MRKERWVVGGPGEEGLTEEMKELGRVLEEGLLCGRIWVCRQCSWRRI